MLRKIRWKEGQGLVLLIVPEFVLAEAQNQIVLNEWTGQMSKPKLFDSQNIFFMSYASIFVIVYNFKNLLSFKYFYFNTVFFWSTAMKLQ